MTVRSLYFRIVLTSMATLLLSLVTYLAIVVTVGRARTRENMHRFAQIELELLTRTYERRGVPGIREDIAHLDRMFSSTHFVVDTSGRDILTGEDRRPLMKADINRGGLAGAVRQVDRYIRNSIGVSAHWSEDGRFCLVTVSHPWETIAGQIPYLLALLVLLAGLYSWLALRIVSLLREMSSAANRFGSGDLDARVEHAERRDELGDVARNFNSMASRIRGLVLSQRQLLQDVSHELRSPLARLSFAAELARTAPDRDGAIDAIMKQVRCLSRLVTELLQLARAESDPRLDAPDTMSPERLVRGVIETTALQASETKCAVTLTSETVRLIRGEQALVARAVDNVVRNAIQHSPHGGSVRIHLSDAGECVAISVWDEGPGVPDQMLERIFEPFVRVDGSRQQETGGVGLGLSIVRRIVRVHCGTCVAENTRPGLKVTMNLPAGPPVSAERRRRSAA